MNEAREKAWQEYLAYCGCEPTHETGKLDFEAGYDSRDAEVDALRATIAKLVVTIDTDYCETCAEREGIFDHLKEATLSSGTQETK